MRESPRATEAAKASGNLPVTANLTGNRPADGSGSDEKSLADRIVALRSEVGDLRSQVRDLLAQLRDL